MKCSTIWELLKELPGEEVYQSLKKFNLEGISMKELNGKLIRYTIIFI